MIFCLQEVSYEWSGRLHAFFANRGYHMITELYGKRFNNYMGVAMAYPLEAFETKLVDVVRLSDVREGGWPREKKKEEEEERGRLVQWGSALASTLNSALLRGAGLVVSPLKNMLGFKPPLRRVIDHWSISEGRHNVLLTARLRPRGGGAEGEDGKGEGVRGGSFCVSNYHMPCAFFAPMVMNIHADMAARRCQKMATTAAGAGAGGGGSVPHILAGDFNLMPDSSHYRLLTTGTLNAETDDTYPSPKFGTTWKPTAKGMRSAYGESDHGEPDFTNYAKVRMCVFVRLCVVGRGPSSIHRCGLVGNRPRDKGGEWLVFPIPPTLYVVPFVAIPLGIHFHQSSYPPPHCPSFPSVTP